MARRRCCRTSDAAMLRGAREPSGRRGPARAARPDLARDRRGGRLADLPRAMEGRRCLRGRDDHRAVPSPQHAHRIGRRERRSGKRLRPLGELVALQRRQGCPLVVSGRARSRQSGHDEVASRHSFRAAQRDAPPRATRRSTRCWRSPAGQPGRRAPGRSSRRRTPRTCSTSISGAGQLGPRAGGARRPGGSCAGRCGRRRPTTKRRSWCGPRATRRRCVG